jgi:hypothetical protein
MFAKSRSTGLVTYIDHNGVVRKHFRGSPTEKDLENAIAALLNEARQGKPAQSAIP